MVIEQDRIQLTFEALDLPTPKIELDNCRVTAPPHTRKIGEKNEWVCDIAYQTDLWHQEDFGSFTLHTAEQAEEAQKKRLKTGDLIAISGVPWTQEVTLQSGEIKTFNHVNITHIEIVSRARQNNQLHHKRRGSP